jgi:diguanylate cyclase (GGDEF)-like protein/PAS domain S-box-containing protein
MAKEAGQGMASQELRVLMLEDDAADAELCERELRRGGLEPKTLRVAARETFERALHEFAPAIILSDFNLHTAFDGLTALEIALKKAANVPFIFVSGTIGEDRAAEAMKRGAADYVVKDRLHRLPEAVAQALQKKQQRAAEGQAADASRRREIRLLEFMNSSPSLMFIKDVNRRYLVVNQEFCRRFGLSERDVIGRTDGEIFPPHQAAEFRANDERVLATRAPGEFEERAHYVDGKHLSIVYKFPLFDAGGEITGIGGVAADVTQRTKAQHHLSVQHAVARVLAETVAYEETAAKLLRVTCENMDFTVGALWEVDGNAGVMRCTEIWHAASPSLAQFSATTREMTLRPGAGIAGRAWQSGAPTWIPDATTNPRSPRARYAATADLHENLAFPITVRGEITGVMDFFGPQSREPEPGQLEVFADIGTQIGQFMERRNQQRKIARLNRIHAVLSSINSEILRQSDRQKLFDEACRIAVEHGKFPLAWISLLDPATLDVTPCAWAGFGSEEMKSTKTTARADVPLGQGLVGHAIRERKPVFTNDLATETRGLGGRRRSEALRLGYRSLIVLPLFKEDAVVGVLGLHAIEPNFFDEEELKLLVALVSDISFALDYLAKGEKLHHLVNYDALTGLLNRALFQERLAHALHAAGRDGGRVAVLFFDPKRFRLVNETLGRQAGDALLRELARRIRLALPDPENLARIAGDCFAVLLQGINGGADIAHFIEQSLGGAVAESFVVEEKDLRISLTTGIAVFPADGDTPETLLRNVEAAWKKAKAAGERYAFYQSEMNAKVAETLSLENKMRRAIDREQFVLHYQPKVELASGKVIGVEALIRWNDPETGLIVPPMEFIRLLEDTGMILEAGRWAISRALEDYRKWHSEGVQPPRISVNVSPIQLRQKDFVDIVRDLVRKSVAGWSHGLDLEITESVVMENIEDGIEKLRAVRGLGINIAIDDFGTGHSSLGYLARLPVNTLKIDRSFIITMDKAPDSMAIVSTIISLAHALKLNVVAEGVDSESQMRLLKSLQCDEIQGYLISKPLPAADLVRFLREKAAPA